MSVDYSSTAKALALDISPPRTPILDQDDRPPWSRRLPTGARRRTNSSSRFAPSNLSYKDQILRSADKLNRHVLSTYKKLSPVQRILAISVAVILLILSVLFLVFNEKIFSALAPAAKTWRDVPGGWTILWALTFICAFPPVIGYSTTVTIAGFVYGFPNGWFIVASATVMGSLASFLASRTILSDYVHRLVGSDKRFEALALTLKHDGIKILCMIRFCPLPYSLSNAAMSTFPTVHPLSFALATLVASPKLLIHVFIGSRLADIAERGGKMDTSTRIVNYCSIGIGTILGIAVGWVIYRKTMARARELEVEELEAGRGEGPLPGRRYSDAGVEDADVAALMNDDDISLWENDGSAYRDSFLDGGDDDIFASGDLGETKGPRN